MEEGPNACWHSFQYAGTQSRAEVLRQVGEEAANYGLVLGKT